MSIKHYERRRLGRQPTSFGAADYGSDRPSSFTPILVLRRLPGGGSENRSSRLRRADRRRTSCRSLLICGCFLTRLHPSPARSRSSEPPLSKPFRPLMVHEQDGDDSHHDCHAEDDLPAERSQDPTSRSPPDRLQAQHVLVDLLVPI